MEALALRVKDIDLDRRQITVRRQIVESRNKLPVREIPSGAKDHDRTRLRHRTTREALEQRINSHFVGHNSRLVTERCQELTYRREGGSTLA